MKHLESYVNECLIQHEGGEAFFDALDDLMRNDTLLMTMLLGKVLEQKFDYLIVSGNFGQLFKKFCSENMPETLTDKVITVPGGLRNGTAVTPFWEEYEVSNKKFIFLDDSFYAGRTRNKIKEAIEEHNGTLDSTYVFYDGSNFIDKSVHSFYRYYDHH